MTIEPIPASLPLEAVTLIAQLRRENERLQSRNSHLDDQVRALLVLQSIANTLSAELNLAPLLRRVAAAALKLTSAQASMVYLLDSTRTSLIAEAVENEQTAATSGSFAALGHPGNSRPGALTANEDDGYKPRIGLDNGVAGWVAATGSVVLIAETAGDLRFSPQALAVDAGLLGVVPHSLVAVPMVFKGDVTGVLEVAQTTGGAGFDASSLDLMRTLGAQAATAVANAQLYQGLRAERDLIIETQEDERKRISRELHDGPAQVLAQIAMSLEFAVRLAAEEPDRLIPELRELRERTISTTRDIRNLLFDLRPLVLDAENGGLVAAMEHFLERFQDTSGPQIHLNAEYASRLSHNAELTVFAILQEAVNNVLKHAHAQNCWIEIREPEGWFVATIRDDGAGFDVNQVRDDYASRGSWGLLSMSERAALIEARLNIASHPGGGTVTTLEVPR
ncbi:MAG TPA: GAF domain-containing sensor histidine kinase [Ktedonobacterales bacterium]|nr:GAF domain-containing sensor histidine kinase [Ktedonobacterales bacterium]